MKRVAVIGSGGAGKSTFARQLGERTSLPVIHLDALFWRPNWEPTSKPEWIELECGLVAGERWIWTYPAQKRPDVLARLSALPPTTRVVRLRSRREMRDFLEAAA